MKTFILLALISELAFAQGGGTTSTNAAPPKFSSNYIERINLASEVPNPIDAFNYQVTGELNGVVYYTDKVPLIEFVNSETGKARVGDIPVGSAVKLEKIMGYGGRHYYGIDIKVNNGKTEISKTGWLDGMFIKVSGINSSASVK